jgi:hypothetical protein
MQPTRSAREKTRLRIFGMNPLHPTHSPVACQAIPVYKLYKLSEQNHIFAFHYSFPIYYAFYLLLLLLLLIIIITSLLLLFQEENEKVLSKRSPQGFLESDSHEEWIHAKKIEAVCVWV